jgi:2-oxoglutarate ferredoxin oxidoreductase subunit alpha
MREAVAGLRAAGHAISALTLQSLWPVPERAIRDALHGATRVVVAELNHGQYRREIERLVKRADVVGLHRVDGELIAPEAFEEAAR